MINRFLYRLRNFDREFANDLNRIVGDNESSISTLHQSAKINAKT